MAVLPERFGSAKEADVGEMKIVGLSAESLAAAGGRAIIVAGSASLEVTEEHLRQISADGPVFLSSDLSVVFDFGSD